MITNDYGDQIETAIKTHKKTISERAAQFDRVYTIKKEMAALTDEEWILFADSIYNETLCTVYEYALDRAKEEKGNNCGF
jgi:hypothetical protein